MERFTALFAALLATCAGAGCRDLSGFTTAGDRYEGPVVVGDFVRAGVEPGTTLCLSLDADHLQDAPGALSTSDGRFRAAALRPIPQIWHDSLSLLTFGEGRLKNLVYVAEASAPGTSDAAPPHFDVVVIVSLMQSGGVEVRLLRGAPPGTTDARAAAEADNIFAIFDLSRKQGACAY